MSSLQNLLRFVAPPLVVATAVGALLARALSPDTLRPSREESIRTRWSVPAEYDALGKDVEAYLRAYGEDPEARWLATEAYARMLLPMRAFEVAFPGPAARADPAKARRFAALMLEVLGEIPGPPPRPSALWARTTLARVDAGDVRARDEMFEAVSAIGMNEIVAWLIPAYRSETGGKRTLIEALARRPDPHFQLAAAIGATGPKQASRLPLLLETLRSSEWRERRRPTWQQVARAVGSSGTPEALAALRAEAAQPVEAGPDGDLRRGTLDVALALAGDEDARARVLAAMAEPGGGTGWIALLYVAGLQTQFFQGDAAAAERLAALWPLTAPRPAAPGESPAESVPRLQLVVGLLLSDPLPPPSIPAGDWAREFETHESPLHRAIALSWRWRHREPGSFEKTVEELGRGLREYPVFLPAAYDTAGVSAVVELLRAWYRWA